MVFVPAGSEAPPSDSKRHRAGSPQAPPTNPSPTPSPPPPARATAADAASRAAAELAHFQNRQAGDGDDVGDDVDPDAPAAMKDSPSVSGDEDESGEQSV